MAGTFWIWLTLKGKITYVQEVLEALEALCCFDAWTCMEKYWKIDEEYKYATNAQESICNLLDMIKIRLPHADGCGWKLVTFHNITHIVSDMKKFGKPKEVNTEIGEKNHKYLPRAWAMLHISSTPHSLIRYLCAYQMHSLLGRWPL